MSFPTRNRDVDREILKRMDDHTFLSVCTSLLKRGEDDYLEKLCSGDRYYPNLFELRLRTDPRYIGTYAYKPKDISWRKYFAHVILWFEKLKTLGYDFTGNRGDPKIYHDILSKSGVINKPWLEHISPAIPTGYLDLVIFLTRFHGFADRIYLNVLLDDAFLYEQVEIAAYLVSIGAKISDEMIRLVLNRGTEKSLDFILDTTEFDYAQWFSYLRAGLPMAKWAGNEKIYQNMIDYLNEKFKLTLPVLPKFTMKN